MIRQYINLDCALFNDYCVAAEALINYVRISTKSAEGRHCQVNLSYPDARRLVEMLVKHTHPGHSIEPSKPVKAPQLILAWLHPANGHRFMHVSNEAVATDNAYNLKRNLPDFPIWLAQITKQYVQPNPTYEWKDL